MHTTDNALAITTVYVFAAFALTIWLARTLFHNGGVFLQDVFEDKPSLAEAVNRLLVVGFFMFSLGWGLFMFQTGRELDTFDATQLLIQRLAVLLLVLGAVHFGNVFVFWRIRAKHEERNRYRHVLQDASLSQLLHGDDTAPPTPPRTDG